MQCSIEYYYRKVMLKIQILYVEIILKKQVYYIKYCIILMCKLLFFVLVWDIICIQYMKNELYNKIKIVIGMFLRNGY